MCLPRRRCFAAMEKGEGGVGVGVSGVGAAVSNNRGGGGDEPESGGVADVGRIAVRFPPLLRWGCAAVT